MGDINFELISGEKPIKEKDSNSRVNILAASRGVCSKGAS
jgi:hypothetical protein